MRCTMISEFWATVTNRIIWRFLNLFLFLFFKCENWRDLGVVGAYFKFDLLYWGGQPVLVSFRQKYSFKNHKKYNQIKIRQLLLKFDIF